MTKPFKAYHSEYKALLDFMSAADHYSNFSSNFSACISIMTNAEDYGENLYAVQVPSSAISSDWIYHINMFNNLEHIKELKRVRRIFYSLPKPTQNILLLAFNNSKGKFNIETRLALTVKLSFDERVDLSAICFNNSKFNTIAEFEKHVVTSKKEIVKSELSTAKESFVKAFMNFATEYNTERTTV